MLALTLRWFREREIRCNRNGRPTYNAYTVGMLHLGARLKRSSGCPCPRRCCYNVLSYDSVERRILKTEMLRVHYRKRLDMSKIVSTHTFMCFSKHRFRIVYPEHADGAWIVNQGDARPT